MRITLRKIEEGVYTPTRIKMEAEGRTLLRLSSNGVFRDYCWGPSTPFDLNSEGRIREER